MSSTTSSDQLTLLSYATFNYHIPIHDHSDSTWRQQQWKQAETMIALTISLTECQEALSERQFEKKRMKFTLSGADVHVQSIGIDS